jgi:hypothetical protein
MSHVSIAAALALEDVSAGERLAAFALASFANREHCAWPGTRVAAVRAGLSRSQYLAARDGLVTRGLIAVEEARGGRGNSPVVTLTFASAGPWFDREVNAPLFEALLSYSPARGSARLLLAALAALADEELAVTGVSTEELRAAAGMADSTYRRARAALLASGQLALEMPGGGRARTNCWVLRDPRAADAQPAVASRTRVAPPRAARPLVAAVHEAVAAETDVPLPLPVLDESANGPGLSGVSTTNPAQHRTVSPGKGPELNGVSTTNPAHSRTVSAETPPETPPQTPPETPPPNARAGREPQNQGIVPPSPPDGGSRGRVTIVEDYVTERGRRRQRMAVIDIDAVRRQLGPPTGRDSDDWQRTRDALRHIVGESTFEIWLAELELIAVHSNGCLLLTGRAATHGWVATRFSSAFDRAVGPLDRSIRLASDRELQLLDALAKNDTSRTAVSPLGADSSHHDHKEAISPSSHPPTKTFVKTDR